MKEKVFVNGMVWGGAKPVIPPIDYEQFKEELLCSLGKPRKKSLSSISASCKRFSLLRSSFEIPRLRNLNDPSEVGWALLLPPEGPETREIANALKPLIQHRNGRVIFGRLNEEWIENEYTYKPDNDRPYYILLAGPPSEIPFNFQYLLDTHAAVGRLAFNRLDDYATYAEKVVDYENSTSAGVERRANVFATAHSVLDVTYLSKIYMADVLVKIIQGKNMPATYLSADDATLCNFINMTKGDGTRPSPALIYTASHGLAVPGGIQNEDVRHRLQGAICCQDYDGKGGLFSADEIPSDPFLYGSIIFTFACYGAGTPRRSDFFHWVNQPSLLEYCPREDFVAALPTKLLAHAKGPVAFIGHIDPAWLCSFASPTKGYGARMGSFTQAVEQLLDGFAIGYAVKKFNEVYTYCNTRLTMKEDEFRANRALGKDEKWTDELVELWVTRNDSQNYITLGDPAVRVKYV